MSGSYACVGPHRRSVGLSLGLVILTGCQGSGASPAPSVCQDLGAAQAAFIEYLWAHNHSAIGVRASAVFVALPDDDAPGDDLLMRLDGIPVPVGPVSQAVIDESGTVRDPASGARALIFRVTAIRRTGPEAVEIRGGYYEGSLSASRATYEMTCREAGWQVTAVGPMMISDATASTATVRGSTA